MSLWKYSICGPCGTGHHFPNLNGSISSSHTGHCPLDQLYNRVVRVNNIATGLTPANDQELLNLLVVELVSAVESYFKDILSSLVGLCPLVQKQATELNITLGSALWGFKSLQSRLGFEQNSLASSDNLKRTLSKMKLFKDNDESITTILSIYDQICELRHVIAHSKGLVTGKNALIIGIEKSATPIEIRLTVTDLQEIANLSLIICRAFHQDLFLISAKRWALNWKKEIPGWNKRKAVLYFKRLWNLFYSTQDSAHIQTHYVLSEKNAREAIESEFRVSY